MKNKITLIIAIAAIAVAIFAIKSCRKYEQQASAGGDSSIVAQNTQYYKDMYGKEHARAEVLETEYAGFRMMHSWQMDSLANLLNIKPKRINTIQQVPFVVHDSIKISVPTMTAFSIRGCDTIVQPVNYDDGFLSLHGVILHDTLNADYTYEDSLIIVGFQKRQGLFGLGKPVQLRDYSFGNAKTKIVRLVDRTKPAPAKHFTISAQTGYGVVKGLKQPFTTGWYGGVGLGYTFGGF